LKAYVYLMMRPTFTTLIYSREQSCHSPQIDRHFRVRVRAYRRVRFPSRIYIGYALLDESSLLDAPITDEVRLVVDHSTSGRALASQSAAPRGLVVMTGLRCMGRGARPPHPSRKHAPPWTPRFFSEQSQPMQPSPSCTSASANTSRPCACILSDSTETSFS